LRGRWLRSDDGMQRTWGPSDVLEMKNPGGEGLNVSSSLAMNHLNLKIVYRDH
jgi:hypothetical protein